MQKIDKVQVFNPKSQTYVLLDITNGKIISHHPKRNMPYKGVRVVKE